ncbi:MAG TPA: hypothetical protein VK638_45260 [Edaphobacter sp.]|nr:hypothetical protein [Edaphobacter sp.]
MEVRLLPAMLCFFASVTAHNVTSRIVAAPSPPAPAVVNLSLRAAPLEILREIGFQTRVPIGIIPGEDSGALCRTKKTFVFLGEDPRSALDAMAQELHYTLNEEDGVFLLAAPDVTSHQRDVLDHRFRVYRHGGKSVLQMVSVKLKEALWAAFTNPVSSGYGGSIYHSVDAPKISLPPVLRNVTAQEIAGLAVKTGPRGIYLSRIQPSRMASPDDLTIQISSYGDPKQLNLDLRCQQ